MSDPTTGNAGTTPTANTISFADMLVVAADLGKQAGQGKDVQIKFDLKVLEAAFHGSLDLDPNKHGADTDDATKLSEAYARAQNSAVIFDAKAGNQRKLISNVRKGIKLGMWPKGGPGEPLQTVNTLISMRQKLRQDPANAKKLDDAHNTLMRYATTQLKRDHVLDESELRTFCFKAIPEARDGAEVIEAVRKTLNNLKVGKINNCPDLDNSQEVQDMIRLCTKRLVAIAKAKGVQPADPKSAAKVAPTGIVNQATP